MTVLYCSKCDKNSPGESFVLSGVCDGCGKKSIGGLSDHIFQKTKKRSFLEDVEDRVGRSLGLDPDKIRQRASKESSTKTPFGAAGDLAYSILSPLADGHDVPLTVSLSMMCELIDSSAMPLSRKHQIIEQTKKQLEKKTPSNYEVK